MHRREVQRLLEQTRSLIAQGPGHHSPYAAGPAALADSQIAEARHGSPLRNESDYGGSSGDDTVSPSRRAVSVAEVRYASGGRSSQHGVQRIGVPSLPPRASTVMGILYVVTFAVMRGCVY